MNFFTNLFIAVDAAINDFLTVNVILAASYAAPFIYSLGVILIITIGLGLMFGEIQQPAKPLLLAVGTIAIVTVFATNVGVYNLYFKNLLIGLPDDLISLAGGTDVGTQLDDFGTSILEGITKMWRSSSGIVAGLKAAVASLLMFVIWLIMSVAALVMLLLAKVGLAVLVAVGPIFIGLAIHPVTREYFTKWLSYCTNFAFLALLVGGVLNLVSEIASGYFNAFAVENGKVDFVIMAAPALIMGSVIGLFSQLPSIASSLGGGVGLSAGNFAGSAVSKLSEPARQGIKKVTGGEKREIKRNAKTQDKTRQVAADIRRKRMSAKVNKD